MSRPPPGGAPSLKAAWAAVERAFAEVPIGRHEDETHPATLAWWDALETYRAAGGAAYPSRFRATLRDLKTGKARA